MFFILFITISLSVWPEVLSSQWTGSEYLSLDQTGKVNEENWYHPVAIPRDRVSDREKSVEWLEPMNSLSTGRAHDGPGAK